MLFDLSKKFRVNLQLPTCMPLVCCSKERKSSKLDIFNDITSSLRLSCLTQKIYEFPQSPVHTTQEELENGGFTLKTHQMSFVHTRKRIKCLPSTLRRRNVKTQQSQVPETLECTREHAHSKVLIEPTWPNQHGITISAAILDLCLRKTQADKSPDYRDVIVFEKLRFQNVFRPH